MAKIYRNDYASRAEYNAALAAQKKTTPQMSTYKPTATEAQKTEAKSAVERGVITQQEYNKMYVAPATTPTTETYTPSTVAPAEVKYDEETGQPEETQLSAELNAARGVLGDIKSFASELGQSLAQQQQSMTESLMQQSESYKASFEQLQKSMGDQAEIMQTQMDIFQKQTGMIVDITAKGFQEEAQKTLQEGGDLNAVFQKYTMGDVGKQRWATAGDTLYVENLAQQAIKSGLGEEQAQEALDALSRGTLSPQQATEYFKKFTKEPTPEDHQKETQKTTPIPQETTIPEVTDVISPKDQTNAVLDNIIDLDGGTLLDNIMTMDWENMSSADVLKTLFYAQIQELNDPTMNSYFNKMADRTDQAYESALTLARTSISEVDKALDGEDFIPTTYEGLAAKIAKQGMELQTESIEGDKAYRQEQYDLWLDQEQDKRARLEGYLKAKLYASGAQDSSAGLMVMSCQVNAADARLQSAASEHNYAISKLNLEARSVMMNYTNQVSKIALDIESKKSEAAQTYSDEMFKIEGLVIQDEQEKRKLTLSAISEYNDKLYTLKKDQQDQAFKVYQQQYKEMQDTIDNAYKLSGLMGTVYGVDDNGNVFDTGVSTFEASKWADSNMLQWAQYEHSINQDSFTTAMKLLDTYGSSMAPTVEQMLGMNSGALSGYKTIEEQKLASENWFSNLISDSSLFESTVGLSVGTDTGGIGVCYENGADGGQCGEFMHKLYDLGYSMGDSLQSKMQTLINTPEGYVPQIGDMVITNESATYGHVASINNITADGKLVLTESNYYQKSMGAEKVSNTRQLDVNSSAIMGYHHGDLKPEIQAVVDIYTATKQGGAAGLLKAGGNLLYNYFTSKQNGQNTEVVKKVENSSFPTAMTTMFESYQKGEKWVQDSLKTPQDKIAFQMAYNTWRSQDEGKLQDSTELAFESAKNAIQLLPNISTDKGLLFSQELDKLIRLGEYDKAKEAIKRTTLNADDVSSKNLVLGRETTIRFLDRLKEQLNDFYAAGGTTNLLQGKWEKVFQKVGATHNPKLNYIAKEIQDAVSTYTVAKSGVQFSDKEREIYEALFPSIENVGELNMSTIDSLRDMTAYNVDDYYRIRLGDSVYNTLFIPYVSTSEYNPSVDAVDFSDINFDDIES